jgi:hypothetical protein
MNYHHLINIILHRKKIITRTNNVTHKIVVPECGYAEVVFLIKKL